MTLLRLHHLNLTSMVPSAVWDFYVNKLGLDDDPEHWTPSDSGFEDNRFAKSAGGFEFHFSKTDPGMSQRFGQPYNPLLRGHLAFEVSDIAAIRARLDEQQVPYADYGTSLGGTRTQIFVADPSGRIVELRDPPEG